MLNDDYSQRMYRVLKKVDGHPTIVGGPFITFTEAKRFKDKQDDDELYIVLLPDRWFPR